MHFIFYFLDLEIIYGKKHIDTIFSRKSNLFLSVIVSDALILVTAYIAFSFAYINGAINALEYNEENRIQPRQQDHVKPQKQSVKTCQDYLKIQVKSCSIYIQIP